MRKVKNFKEYISWQISISDFLASFYNYPSGVHCKFTHDDIKSHLPFVKRVRCDSVTREQIYRGEIVLVKDVLGTVFAYQNPFVFEEYNEIMDTIKENENLISGENEESDGLYYFDEELLKNMNCYELKKLMETAKKNNDCEVYYLLRRELCSRKNNKDKKEKALRKIRFKEERMMLDD